MPICICHVATASPVQDEYLCWMSIGMVIALEVRRLFSPLVHLLINPYNDQKVFGSKTH